jgi:flagellar biosynthesis protein FliR
MSATAHIQQWLIVVLLVSLRIVPTLAFSPPFTLVRVPVIVRVMVCLAFSASMVAAHPAETTGVYGRSGADLALAASELIIGLALAIPLQFAFAALLTAGRAIDLQAGYAFAMIADPSSRTQMPLIGMIFAYAAAAVFFTSDAPADLLSIWSMSLEQAPLGAALDPAAPATLAAYAGAVFVLAFGGGGLVLLVLFMIDAAIALVSRTLPQMNVLFLGFQVKAITTLVILPLALAGSTALFLRLFRFSLETMTRLI